MNERLPAGWTEANLGELASDITYGYTAKSSADPIGPRMLRITDIQDDRVNWSTVPHCSISEEDLSKYKLERGDLVFARTGATVGKSFLIREEIPDSVYASYLIRVRCRNYDLARYLSHFFRSPIYWSQITDASSGIGQPNVNGSKLKQLRIPVAPAAEQKRIADKLDRLLAAVDTCKARLDAIPAILKRFRQSVLAAATSGELTEEWRAGRRTISMENLLDSIALKRRTAIAKGELKRDFFPRVFGASDAQQLPALPRSWAYALLDQLAEPSAYALKAGPFGSALKKDSFVASGYKVYGQEQVIRGDQAYGDYYISSEKFETLSSCAVKPSDILISLVGTIGKVLVLSANCERGIINPRLLKVSLAAELHRDYFRVFLSSPACHRFYRTESHGGTMEILNLQILRDLPIPVPPIEEQVEIAARADRLLARIDQMTDAVTAARSTIDSLAMSFLKRAFSGRLVVVQSESTLSQDASDLDCPSINGSHS